MCKQWIPGPFLPHVKGLGTRLVRFKLLSINKVHSSHLWYGFGDQKWGCEIKVSVAELVTTKEHTRSVSSCKSILQPLAVGPLVMMFQEIRPHRIVCLN